MVLPELPFFKGFDFFFCSLKIFGKCAESFIVNTALSCQVAYFFNGLKKFISCLASKFVQIIGLLAVAVYRAVYLGFFCR